MSWREDQEWESEWWGDCTNTYCEEMKQTVYAQRMGLVALDKNGRWPVYDLAGRSVLDIGGGPVSMLLKTVNGERLTVADPCSYPEWVGQRYEAAGIDYLSLAGEDLIGDLSAYDECWIYNVLQHVQDPRRIIENARRLAPAVRLFEWVNIPTSPGHPHVLTVPDLAEWLGGTGGVEALAESGCHGTAFYGIFTPSPIGSL